MTNFILFLTTSGHVIDMSYYKITKYYGNEA